MSSFQRIGNIIMGAVMLLFAVILLLSPEDGSMIVAVIISISLFVYGFKMLWYYLRMARHSVGGKAILYQAIIILDFGLVSTSMLTMGDFMVGIYLLGVFAFAGAIDILRSFEAKKVGVTSWKIKFYGGIVKVLAALALLLIGVIFKRSDILVYGYVVVLVYAAAMRFVNAFKKTAIVYIQ